MGKEEDSTFLQLVPSQSALPVEFDDPARNVFEFWKAIMSHPRAQLGPTRRRVIEAMLRIGYTADDLRLAIVGCKRSPRHQGHNENHEIYDDLELICRDESHVDRFLRLGEKYINGLLTREREESTEHRPVPMPAGVRAKLEALFSAAQKRLAK